MEEKLIKLGYELLIFLSLFGALALVARYTFKRQRINRQGYFAHTGFCPGHELSAEDELTIYREIQRDQRRNR